MGRLPFALKWVLLQLTLEVRSSSNDRKIKVDFHLTLKLKSSSIYPKSKVVFHLTWNLGCLPFKLNLRSSSIYPKIKVVFHLLNQVRLPPEEKKLTQPPAGAGAWPEFRKRGSHSSTKKILGLLSLKNIKIQVTF